MATPAERKRGRLSASEASTARALAAAGVAPAEIAARLNRTVEAVEALLAPAAAAPPAPPPPPDPLRALRSTIAWRHLTEEFDPKEVRYFEEKYLAYKEQFQEDLMASEDAQLFKAIKAELLMHRNLVQQRRVQGEIDRLEAERDEALRAVKGDPTRLSEDERARLLVIDTFLRDAYEDKQGRANEYDKLDKAHGEVMRSLKATREQRFARVENSKRTFLDVVRMFCERDAADRADRQLDQVRRARDKELARLGAVHQFADGAFDRPILSADTVLADGDGGKPAPA